MSQLIALVSVSPLETVSSRFPGGPEIYSLLGMPSFILAAIFKVKMVTASSGGQGNSPRKDAMLAQDAQGMNPRAGSA